MLIINPKELPEDVCWIIESESITLRKEGEIFVKPVGDDTAFDSIKISKEFIWKFIKNLAAYEAKNDENKVIPEDAEIIIKEPEPDMPIETVEDAKKLIKNFPGPRPMTTDPRVNFLLDVAAGRLVEGSVDWPEEKEWDEVKDEYVEEVEAYERDDVDLEPYEVEELEEYL